jgi:hypothetical protein
MEMSLMQARYEASKAKEENERQAGLERQVRVYIYSQPFTD